MASATREELYKAIVTIGLEQAIKQGKLDGALGEPGAAAVTVDTLGGATATGKTLMKAADGPAARTAIGAGTSSLAVGTTASTAKAGNYVPTSAEVAAGLKAKAQIAALTSAAVGADAAALVTTVNAIIAALKA